MALEACPYCGESFDSQNHRYTGGLMSYFKFQWPSEQLDQQFTVRCPHCGIAYVSSSVKFLGFLTRRTCLPFFLIVVIVVAVLTYGA